MITHAFVSLISDDPVAAAAGEVLPSNWNADHVLKIPANSIIGNNTGVTADAAALSISQAQTLLGLGSAAYTSSSLYDVAGSASTVQGNLDTHIGLTGTSVHGLGSSSTHAATDFQSASGNLTSLAGLSYTAAAFVKMTSANTFALDTSTYLTSLSGAVLTDQTSGQTIGSTGSRLTKLWAIDITATNAISGSVTGNAGTVTGLTLTTNLTNNGGAGVITWPALGATLTVASTASVSGSNTGDQVVPSNEAGASNNFLTAYNSSTGAFSKARPTWANIDKSTSSIADITTRSHTSLTDIGTNTHAQVDTSLLSLTTKVAELTVINGQLDIAESAVSFVDGTRTFTIAPVAASFSFHAGGLKYTKTIAQTLVIPDVEGLYYIYFDGSGNLQYQSFGEDVDNSVYSYVVSLYWDATNKTANFFGDERHGVVMNAGTHQYLHDTQHSKIETGLALADFVVDASGSLDVHAEFSVGSGIIWDEDLVHNISSLGVPANIPIYYKLGASGNWRKKAKNNFPLIYKQAGTNARADYNQFTGGAWQLTEVPNLDYLLVHYFATNNIADPVIGICGQNVYTTLANARAGADVEISTIVTAAMPTLEFVPIATVIWQTGTTYANTPSSKVRSTTTGTNYVDWRTTTVTTLGGGGVVWGNIGGTLSNQADLQAALDLKAPLISPSFTTPALGTPSAGVLSNCSGYPAASTSIAGLAPVATAPAAGLINVVGIANTETAYTNKPLFDATSPETQAFGDAAAVGTAIVAARRDHKHAMMSAPSTDLSTYNNSVSMFVANISTNPISGGIAIGNLGDAIGTSSLSIGNWANADATFGLALGSNVRVAQFNSSAIGSGYTSGSEDLINGLVNSVMFGVGSINPILTLGGSAKFDTGAVIIANTGSLGTELLAKGDFVDNTVWTYGSGWTWNAGGWADHNSSGTAKLQQTVSGLTVGATYLLSYSIIAITASSITPGATGASFGLKNQIQTGAKEFFVCTNTSTVISFTPVNTFRGSIDNVSLKQVTGGDIVIAGSVKPASVQTTVNGSTSGSAVFSQPMQGASYKRVIIYCNALNGTASYTYPTEFLHTPQILSAALGAIPTTVSATAVTLTGATNTGFIELSGF